jgi:isopenicillin-N epimerase
MDSPGQTGRSASPIADWALDPTVTFLNHGSFGACLRAILEVQRGWRDKLEAQPVRFLARDLEDLLDWSRSEIGAFMGADADDLALMVNATAGLSTVLRSVQLERGDEILITSHVYNSAANAARFASATTGCKIVMADIPFPIQSSNQAFDAIMAAVTPNTKLAMIEHVTSPTALVLPIEQLVPAFTERGIDVLVDGAHGPGMRPIRLNEVAPAYYVGTLHKWVCAPKGSAFLYVRRDRQAQVKPLAISSGASESRTDRSRFRLDFDWNGTFDPSAWLTIPAAIDGLGEMLPGGWPALIETNHRLILKTRAMLGDALHTMVPAPDEMIGSMASLRLPGGPWPRDEATRRMTMIEAAMRGRRFEVPLLPWPSPWLVDWGYLPDDTRFEIIVRISAQAYNYLGQYERLASILPGFAGANRSTATPD